MAGEEHPKPMRLCTECGKRYRPTDGLYGLVCPHCKSGQKVDL